MNDWPPPPPQSLWLAIVGALICVGLVQLGVWLLY